MFWPFHNSTNKAEWSFWSLPDIPTVTKMEEGRGNKRLFKQILLWNSISASNKTLSWPFAKQPVYPSEFTLLPLIHVNVCIRKRRTTTKQTKFPPAISLWYFPLTAPPAPLLQGQKLERVYKTWGVGDEWECFVCFALILRQDLSLIQQHGRSGKGSHLKT